MLNLLRLYEEEFCFNAYRGGNDGDAFRFDNRNSRLILTAPHAVRTFRNAKAKAPDVFTGGLTRLAGERNNVSSIIRRRTGEEKNAVADFISQQHLEHNCFLDIHGMKSSREFELAVGTGILPAAAYAPELELIGQLAEKYQIRWVTNHPNYSGKLGLTGRLQQLIPSPRVLQLEWRSDLRDFYRFPSNVQNRTLPFLSALISDSKLFFRQKQT